MSHVTPRSKTIKRWIEFLLQTNRLHNKLIKFYADNNEWRNRAREILIQGNNILKLALGLDPAQ